MIEVIFVKGTCGHEWQTSVKARSNGEKCPICSGARVIAGINDLAALETLLVKQDDATCAKYVDQVVSVMHKEGLVTE